jgi:hypothetical protein
MCDREIKAIFSTNVKYDEMSTQCSTKGKWDGEREGWERT